MYTRISYKGPHYKILTPPACMRFHATRIGRILVLQSLDKVHFCLRPAHDGIAPNLFLLGVPGHAASLLSLRSISEVQWKAATANSTHRKESIYSSSNYGPATVLPWSSELWKTWTNRECPSPLYPKFKQRVQQNSETAIYSDQPKAIDHAPHSHLSKVRAQIYFGFLQ